MAAMQLSLFEDSAFLTNYKKHTFTSIQIANLLCISNTVAQLFREQQEDVKKAEKRFFIDNKKGILFTNGTGTGKTYTGLGIAKRFVLKDKNDILIVVPTDAKAKDWVKDGLKLDLSITQLENTLTGGKNIVITTYANFYQNEPLLSRNFDLIIYDESHHLVHNEQGYSTQYLEAHKRIANLPSSAKRKALELLPQKPQQPTCPVYPSRWEQDFDTKLKEYEQLYEAYSNEYDRYKVELKTWENNYQQKINEIHDKTKVVFLSATPFAYHKSCIYGDGTLFEIYESMEEKERDYSYNEAHGMSGFLTENFGYRMRYNKPNKAESGVDMNLLERNFFEKMVKEGAISGRQLEVDKDYSREFVLVDSEIGQKINEGIKLFRSWDNKEFREKYHYLSEYAFRKWNYLYLNQLLEAIKATNSLQRIEQHINLGRKVVVFHGYNSALPSHPFQFDAWSLLKGKEKKDYHILSALEKEIQLFEQEYADLANLDIGEIKNVRTTLKEHFGKRCREFNGTIPKKKRYNFIQEFNDPNSNVDLMIIQRKAGKEGISLHDTIGNKPRTLLEMGLPVEPCDCIQVEGRIYRLGLKSNAIIEYPVLHTDFEKIAFADKVATRARTAENLAMGNKARNLELAFKEGYLNATTDEPNLLQGVGGKQADREMQKAAISAFEEAKTFYYAKGSKTSKNKSKEGVDYFATPEPLGLKMVEWLFLNPDDDAMEPSAGHGAIGRFFPGNTKNLFIEPSYSLSAELAMNVTGNVRQIQFENLSTVNKFDGVAMNPPFGKAGKTAMEHVQKAFSHLRRNGRLVALVPMGSSMDKRLTNFFNEVDDKGELVRPDAVLTSEILLPAITFKRAGTMVGTKIIIIDKKEKDNVNMTYKLDFTACKTAEELFDSIEHVSVPSRLGAEINSCHRMVS